MKGKRAVRRILTGFFALVFCFSAYKIASKLYTDYRERQEFDELKALVDDADTQTPPVEKDAEPVVLPEYRELSERNGDFFGWLKIEDTPIDYPVTHTPEDPQYYLHRSFDKSKSQSGTPFLDAACYEGCGIYIVYGHHMKNGTMFGSLPDYGKKAFWETHKTIRFDTLYKRGEYEVIAALYSKIYADGEEGFRYYEYTDLTDPSVFREYMDNVRAEAIYDTGGEAEYGENLLVLSTCNYHTDDGRFVVIAKEKLGEN